MQWDVKNSYAYVPQFFSLISDGLGGVGSLYREEKRTSIEMDGTDFENFGHSVWVVLSLSYILFVPKVGFNRRLFF